MHCATIYQESVCDVTTLKIDALSEQLNHAPFFAEDTPSLPFIRLNMIILVLWWRDVSLLRERGLAMVAITTFGLQFNDT